MALSTARSINKPRLILGLNPQAAGLALGVAAISILLADGLLNKLLIFAVLVGSLWVSKIMQKRDPQWMRILQMGRYQCNLYDSFQRATFTVLISGDVHV